MDEAAPDLMICQETNRDCPSGVDLKMVPVCLRQRFIATHPQQVVLGDDPHSSEGRVIVDIGFRARLSAGVGAKSPGKQLLEADVSQITQGANLDRQAVDKARLFEQGHIRSGTGHASSDIDDVAGIAINRYLTLEGAALLLSAVVAVSLRTTLRTLHRLLKGVDDPGQLRHILQQAVHGAAPLPSRVRQSHRHPTRHLQNRQYLVDVSSRHRIAVAKQAVQRRVVGMIVQPHHAQSQPLDHRQRGVAATTRFALSEWVLLVQPLAAALSQLGENLVGQPVKYAVTQTGHGAEYLWMTSEVIVLKDDDPEFNCLMC